MTPDVKPGEFWVIQDPDDSSKRRCVLITQREVGQSLVGLFTRRACHLYHEVRTFPYELTIREALDEEVAKFWNGVY